METKLPISEALLEIRERLGLLYGPNLREVILYGSWARGEAEADSDIDLLVILDDFENSEVELARIDPFASDVSLEYDVVISFLVIRASDYLERNTPLLLNIRREGVTV